MAKRKVQGDGRSPAADRAASEIGTSTIIARAEAILKDMAEAYDALKEIAPRLWLIEEAKRVKLDAIETERMTILTRYPDPKTLGSNEAIREAKIREFMTVHYSELRDLEFGLAERRKEFRLAELRIERNKSLLRCLELIQGALCGADLYRYPSGSAAR